MIIDTHAHINFNVFKDDADEVIKKSLDNDVWIINVGSQKDTSQRAVDMTEKYNEGVYAAVGLHPIHLEDIEIDEQEIQFHSRAEEFNKDFYKKLTDNEKTVAIGEAGLDYYHIPTHLEEKKVKQKQKDTFLSQLQLAEETELPIIIHCREAHDDLMDILKERYGDSEKKERGVLHCFSGNLSLAKQYIDLGFYIGFTGLITFVSNWDKVIPELPLDKILIETDAPYLTPIPFRGKRNEPLYVKCVAEKMAKLHNFSTEEIEDITFKNALRLFNKIKK